MRFNYLITVRTNYLNDAFFLFERTQNARARQTSQQNQYELFFNTYTFHQKGFIKRLRHALAELQAELKKGDDSTRGKVGWMIPSVSCDEPREAERNGTE